MRIVFGLPDVVPLHLGQALFIPFKLLMALHDAHTHTHALAMFANGVRAEPTKHTSDSILVSVLAGVW